MAKKGENLDKLYNRYFKWQTDFQAKYGEKTVVLCQVGAFFEVYGVDNAHETIGVADQISKILNIICTLKNKKKDGGNNRKNPKMCGFQPPYLGRHLEVLLAQNWTVVVVEQVTPPPNPKRAVTRIYSPGTYLDNHHSVDNNYIASIYIQIEKCYQTQLPIYIIGLAAIDVSTGENVVHSFHVKHTDEKYMEEEIFRFIESYNPKEILINKNIDEGSGNGSGNGSGEVNLEFINFANRMKYENTIKDNPEISKVAYQNQFLQKIFPETGFLSPIEFLDLEKTPALVISYIILLEFVYEHSPTIIQKINLPTPWQQSHHISLNHNTIFQLDVLPGKQLDTHPRFKSLFHVINQTKTPMGRRLLKYQLLNPIYNVETLEKRYQLIERILDAKTIKNFQVRLEDIMDLERQHRKMFLQLLQPHELAELEMSYHSINGLFKTLQEYFQLSDFSIDQSVVDKFQEYFQEYQTIFNLELMLKYSMKTLDCSIFQKGHYPEVDQLQNQIESLENELNQMATMFSDLIEPNSNYVTLEKTEKEGYYFKVTTISRAEAIKKGLGKDQVGKYRFKRISSSNITKIYLDSDDDRLDYLKELKEKIKKPVADAYSDILGRFYQKYVRMFQTVNGLIAQIDVTVSHAKTALLYSYHRPTIQDQSEVSGVSYLDAKDLRHPISERICLGTNYVPNDVQLGLKDNGILLFGINSAGKSCLLKGIGLSIIMAQIGMYVPASSFVYYPFRSIFTRISGDDNMFKGKSSFTIEMHELRSILKYSNQHSLVLGDEICKGTEHISALSIVTSCLEWLSKNSVKFLLATHLHQLAELPEVTNLNGVSLKHLEILYDSDRDCYIYNRKLKDGSGDSLYGLEVAQYIINEPTFIKSATQVRNKLLGKTELLSSEKSNYNAGVYVGGCQICGSQEQIDQHHIIYQSQCNENGFYQHIPKNTPSNLVFLCKKHHQDVHQNKLVIKGYRFTSKGVELEYQFLKMEETKEKNKRNLKFTPEDIEKIMEYKDQKNLSRKFIIYQLKYKHGIDISASTLSKIFNSNYDQ